MVKLNLNNTGELSMVPAGDHVCVFHEVKEATSRNGNPMLVVILKPTEKEFQNNRLYRNYSLTEKAAYYLKRDLLVPFGFCEDDEDSKDFEFDPNELIGRECVATVSVGVYEGKERSQVDSITAA